MNALLTQFPADIGLVWRFRGVGGGGGESESLGFRVEVW